MLNSHSVSLKKYRGQLGHPPSCGLGLKSASSCIPIFRSSGLDVLIMLGILTPSGISTIPTAYGVMCLNCGGETWTVGTDRSERDHDLSASNTPNRNEPPLATVLVELLDSGIT